jgi:hypothetical protein
MLPDRPPPDKTATVAGTRAGPLRFSPAIPDRSFAAQVWKPDGTSLAILDDVNDEGTAYARLFAAAPALLAALEPLVEWVDKHVAYVDVDQLLDAARAAIAKAVAPVDALTPGDLNIPTVDEMFPRSESGVA